MCRYKNQNLQSLSAGIDLNLHVSEGQPCRMPPELLEQGKPIGGNLRQAILQALVRGIMIN